MVITKLHEALAEVAIERTKLDGLEMKLRAMIAELSGEAMGSNREANADAHEAADATKRSQLEDVADIVRSEGKPLHIKVIAQRLAIIYGRPVERSKIEPGMTRHISKVKRPIIAKFAPSTYGLPEWKQQQSMQPTLVQFG